jgi:hypothetical protein
MSAVLGGYLFGINGFMFGGKAGINEMGPAKRTDSNANNTINATSKTSWNPNPATAHGELWQNQSIWADVDTIIKK